MTLTLAPPRATPTLSFAAIERLLFVATVVAAAGIPWLAPRLPMVDLPQHAAQVALWRDLLIGPSPWDDLVRINLATPYLIGYGLMLPLSFVVSVGTAAKIVLTLACGGFVGGCVTLRRRLQGDPRLDWLFLFGFFGFAWQWGFLTFLVAAPLGLFFLVLAHRHAVEPTGRRALGLAGFGVALLFAHGLVFLMAGALGGLMILRGLVRRRGGGAVMALAPLAIMAAALVVFRLATQGGEGAQAYDAWRYGIPLWLRPSASLAYVTGMDWGSPLLTGATFAMLLAPLLLRGRIGRSGGPLLVLGLGVILLAVPNYAFQTAFLSNRFALFLLPFYALAFQPAGDVSARRRGLVLAMMAGSAWLVLGSAAERVRAFGEESRSFETVLSAAEPGRRALALVYDRDSPAAENPQAYMHYAAWYQADRHGFVDFNFASFFPQVVRFRPGRRPPITDRLGWEPGAFVPSAENLAAYDLIFARGGSAELDRLRAASACALTTQSVDGPWTLLRRGACR